MSEATTGVRAAKASVRTMPKLSPASEGAHSTSARASWRCFSRSETLPRASTPRSSSSIGATSAGGGPDERERRRDVLAQGLKGTQGHRQPLALDGLPHEQDAQATSAAVGDLRLLPAGGLQIDAVRDDRVAAPEEPPRGPLGGARDGDPDVQAVEAPAGPHEVGGSVREKALRVAVERPHEWQARTEEGVPGERPGDRLVDVDHVIASRSQLSPQGKHGARGQGHVGHRSVRGQADRTPERQHVLGQLPWLRAGPAVQARGACVVGVRGGQDAGLVALSP